MKGNNTITINAATTMEALQEYFDKRADGGKALFKVDAVRHLTSDLSFQLKVETVEIETGEK